MMSSPSSFRALTSLRFTFTPASSCILLGLRREPRAVMPGRRLVPTPVTLAAAAQRCQQRCRVRVSGTGTRFRGGAGLRKHLWRHLAWALWRNEACPCPHRMSHSVTSGRVQRVSMAVW